jgi:hypothetical protein
VAKSAARFCRGRPSSCRPAGGLAVCKLPCSPPSFSGRNHNACQVHAFDSWFSCHANHRAIVSLPRRERRWRGCLVTVRGFASFPGDNSSSSSRRDLTGAPRRLQSRLVASGKHQQIEKPGVHGGLRVSGDCDHRFPLIATRRSDRSRRCLIASTGSWEHRRPSGWFAR